MRPQMCDISSIWEVFVLSGVWMLPGASVFNSQRPSFDSASCNISPREWHVCCDIDHVIMDFDMKKNK